MKILLDEGLPRRAAALLRENRCDSRYLGFRRTGSRIDQAFRSAIRGGLRQGTLERNGNLIRAT